MPSATSDLASERSQGVFHTVAEIAYQFVELAATSSGDCELVPKLDYCLAQGWLLKTQFFIGSAGVLGCSVVVISPAGAVIEIIRLDAPPSDKPFRLLQLEPPRA